MAADTTTDVTPRPAARYPTECDLVMKGGITSGVVYPSAVLELAKQYRFRNIGGTSVGAIAAALVAAAELGRQAGEGTGFGQLETMTEEIARPGFMLTLFQPRKWARPAFDLLLASMKDPQAPSQGRRMARIGGVLLRYGWFYAVPLLIGWLVLQVVLGLSLGDRWWLLLAAAGVWAVAVGAVVAGQTGRAKAALMGVVAGLALVALWPLVIAPVTIVMSLVRGLTEDNGFGMCPGTAQEPERQGLTEWLHQHVQRSVGRASESAGSKDARSAPVTFGDLHDHGVQLEMMTTNLSTGRPVRLPEEAEEYFFRPEDLEPLFPPVVIAHMKEHAREVQDPAMAKAGYCRMPAARDLPILVGFRMSLSFPVLFTAVRLYALHPDVPDAVVPNWFSDGGIGSNFPIHFFDAWVPSRPTFGLNLGPYAQDPTGRQIPGQGDIGEPVGPTEVRLPSWIEVKKVGGFMHQIVDTMQNWRDNMQAALPGFQDRVYQVRLSGDQGGMNLNMSPADIQDLIRKGGLVGRSIASTFDWDQHFFTRYVTVMQMLQVGLTGETDPVTGTERRGLRHNFESHRAAFEVGAPGAAWLFQHDADWCRQAGVETWALAERARGWVPSKEGSPFGGFNTGTEPRPKPTMRIVPRV